MKVKTSELIGAALNWAVAIAQGYEPDRPQDGQVRRGNDYRLVGPDANHLVRYSPSTNWVQGGPLVEQFYIYLSPPHVVFATRIENGKRVPADKVYHCWTAKVGPNIAQRPAEFAELPMLRGLYAGDGETPLIAICRAVVACKLGDEVEVPDELLEEA